jgi:MFS family permease
MQSRRKTIAVRGPATKIIPVGQAQNDPGAVQLSSSPINAIGQHYSWRVSFILQGSSLAHMTPDFVQNSASIATVTWSGSQDPANPFNWPHRKKVWAIAIGLLANFISSSNGTILSVAHGAINADFGISDASFPNSYWTTTSWGVGGALFPLVLFPIMEDVGVRPVVLGTYFCFTCMLIPVGLAPNFATLVITRFFTGGCVQLLANAVAGIISDVLETDRERSFPIGLYVTTYLVSTSMGPVIGAAILQYLNWRWIGFIELIYTAALLPVFIFCLPESRGSAILQRRAQRLRREGFEARTRTESVRTPMTAVIRKSVSRPVYMLFHESVVIVAAMWAALSLGIIYLFTQCVEQVMSALYGWTAIQAGYAQAAVVVGEILGCGLCAISNTWYDKSASRNTDTPGIPIPEARLYAAVLGGLSGGTGGMLVFGWTSLPLVPWIAPLIGLAMVGFGTTAIIVSNANYLIDAYSHYAASALGAVGLMENMTIAFLPLVTTAMYNNLGFNWASTLLALLSLVLTITPAAMFIYGKQIRSASPFMREAATERQMLYAHES